MPAGAAKTRALDHLYRGQSNDCYWHGLFGGIYISHMRLATFEHLIAAEDLADGAVITATAVDTDLDGIDEALLAAPGQTVVVDFAEGGAIGSWDIRPVRHALAAVLRRRPEASHATLLEHAAVVTADAPGGTTSIHELVRVKERGLADLLNYDAYERRSGHVRFLEPAVTPGTWADASTQELGDFLTEPFELVRLADGHLSLRRDGTVRAGAEGLPVQVEKTFAVGGDRRLPRLGLTVAVENGSDTALTTRIGIEWNLTMLGGGGNPAAWYEVGGERTAHDGSGIGNGVTQIRQGNDHVGVSITTTVDPAADAWWAPIETISNSENGFERVYQGSMLLLSWPLTLGPGERREFRIDQAVTTTRDHAAEEAG
jgi:alpha-amylase